MAGSGAVGVSESENVGSQGGGCSVGREQSRGGVELSPCGAHGAGREERKIWGVISS